MSESEWTKILGWPGYRVYRSEINEDSKTAPVGATQAWEPQAGVFWVWASSEGNCRGVRTRGTGSALLRVPHHGGDRVVPGALPAMWGQGGEGAAAAQQGTVQQAI